MWSDFEAAGVYRRPWYVCRNPLRARRLPSPTIVRCHDPESFFDKRRDHMTPLPPGLGKPMQEHDGSMSHPCSYVVKPQCGFSISYSVRPNSRILVPSLRHRANTPPLLGVTQTCLSDDPCEYAGTISSTCGSCDDRVDISSSILLQPTNRLCGSSRL